MNNVAIFPYNEFVLPVARHLSTSKNFCLKEIITSKGSGVVGKDASFACNHPPIGIIVSDQLDEISSEWDTLLVSVSIVEEMQLFEESLKLFERCLAGGKQIIFADARNTHPPLFLKDLMSSYPGLTHFISPVYNAHFNSLEYNIEYLVPSVPILLVGGLVKDSDSLEIVLSLQEQFKNSGYSVSCFANSDLGLFLRLHSLQHILEDKSKKESEKIIAINQLVRSVIRTERPDLLIIESPDAVLKYDDVTPNGFGILTHMVIQALEPSLFVCSMPVDLCATDLIDRFSRGFMSQYGFPILAAHMSNLLIDSASALQERRISYVHTDMNLVKQKLQTCEHTGNIPVYDIISAGCVRLYQKILSEVTH